MTRMGVIMQNLNKYVIGILISLAGYWLKDNADATRELTKTINNMQLAIVKLEDNDSFIHQKLQALDRRLERIERGKVKPNAV